MVFLCSRGPWPESQSCNRDSQGDTMQHELVTIMQCHIMFFRTAAVAQVFVSLSFPCSANTGSSRSFQAVRRAMRTCSLRSSTTRTTTPLRWSRWRPRPRPALHFRFRRGVGPSRRVQRVCSNRGTPKRRGADLESDRSCGLRPPSPSSGVPGAPPVSSSCMVPGVSRRRNRARPFRAISRIQDS